MTPASASCVRSTLRERRRYVVVTGESSTEATCSRCLARRAPSSAPRAVVALAASWVIAFAFLAGCRGQAEPPLEVAHRLLVVDGPLTPPGAVRRCELGLESRFALGCLELFSQVVVAPAIYGATFTERFTTPPEAIGRPALVDAKLRYGKDEPTRLLPLVLLNDPLGAELEATFEVPPATPPGAAELELRVKPVPPPVQVVETGEVTIERGALLEVGIALDPAGKWVHAAAVELEVEARTAAGTTRLLRAVLDPADPATERWVDRRVSLDPVAGGPVRFIFKSRVLAPPGGEGDPAVGFPLWGTANVLVPRPRGERRSVVLISLDTLRADYLGTYGSERATSPAIDELARQGAVFEQAMATWPSTLVSHMVMLTGVYPAVFGGMEGLRQPLPAAISTLPEILARHGYATAAVTEDGYVVAKIGFQRGFDYYVENRGITFANAQGEAAKTFADGLAWLRDHPDERSFLFLHTYQVHAPYSPPAEFDRFRTYRVDGEERSIDSQAPRGARARAAYAGEVAYTDSLFGAFFAGLDELGLADETIVLVTSDHGEAMGEHGLFGHANGVLGEVLRVPLIVRAPGLVPAGLRVGGQASLVDLAPTILDLVGIEAPASAQGRSLASSLRRGGGAVPVEARAVFAEHRNKTNRLAAARDGSHKWIFDLAPPGSTQVFDVRVDPWEQNPLDDPALLAHGEELRQAYFAAAAEHRTKLGLDQAVVGPVATPDPETAAKLRALGYVD